MYLKRPLTYLFLFLIAFGGFFGNVQIENKHQNNSTIISLSYESSITYAEEPKKPDADSVKAMENYNKMIDSLNIGLGVLNVMVSPIILFAGWLLSPDWTSGDLFGIREPMYRLWVVVSNIVYFVYAILLILIALGTMFNQDKFSYKVMLPKLALGIILVPFTWWFVQWTISISSVITASVMTIPTETMAALNATNKSKWFSDTPSIPKDISIGSGATKAPECPTNCITPEVFLKSSAGTYGPMLVYGYSIFKFQEIQKLDTKVDMASAALKIVHTSIVSTIMFAVFGLLTLALISMLIVRAVKLWMYAVFSPLFTFRFVAGSNLMAGGGDDSDSFSIKEFMGLAFVPAIVGLTLSFGLIMIASVQSTNGDGSVASKTKPCILTDAKGCEIANIMGSPKNSIVRKWEKSKDGSGGGADYKTTTTFNWGDIKVHFLGNATNQKSTESTTQGTIDAAGGIFGTLIIDIIALVFIWMAFMAAKGVSKAVKFAVDPFEKIGQQVGSMAKSLPKYTPLPIPGGSIAGMGKVAEGMSRIPEHKAQKQYDESETGKWIQSQLGGNANATKLNKTQGILQSGTGTELQENLKQYNASDNKELINTLRKDSGKLDQRLEQMGFINSDRAAIMKIINDPNASEEEKLKVQAAMQSGKWMGLTDSKDTLKKMIDNTAKQGASATNGTNSPIGVRLAGTEKININIAGSGFTIENIAGKKDVTFGADDSLKLKGKKAGMSAENFKKSLMNSGTMTDDAAENLVQKIIKEHPDFFDATPPKP